MNLKELKRAFIILKSQKLIDYYDIEIFNKNDKQNKIYKTYFKTYTGKSYFINFGYMKNKNNNTSYIKELIYKKYILA